MFNEFGTPIGYESESMLPPGSIKPHDRLIAESGVEMNWLGVAAGVASFGASWMGSQRAASNQRAAAARQAEAEKRAFANQAAQNAYKTEFEKLMIQAHNEETERIYDIQLDQYREQIQINAESALQSYAQQQRVLNEEFAVHMFGKQKMLKELMEIQGNQLAAVQGNTSKSRDRANMINSLGNFGMDLLMLDENLRGVKSAHKQAVDGISAQWQNYDRDAFSKIAIAPRLKLPYAGAGPQLQGPPPAARIKGPGFGSFLGAASSGLMFGSQVHNLAYGA
jgi:F0F1-type ATP synthase membrane subunit c/vacuolar-type H+-ATPase subunit K